jgi:hypothetical protein
MIGNHQYGMANGHSSSLLAPTGGESAVLSGQVSVPPTTGGMRCLDDEGCPQPRIALGGLAAALAFTSTLVIARTHPCPRGQVPIGGEAAHIRADLGQYRLRHAPSHSRDRLQSLNCFSERVHPLGDLCAQPFDGLLEKVDVCQLLGEEEALVRSRTSPQGLLQLRDLPSQLPFSQLGHRRSVGRAIDQGLEHLPCRLLAHDVRGDRGELYVGSLQGLVQSTYLS